MEGIQRLETAELLNERLSASRRENIVQMVRRWGGATTDAVLDPAMTIFEYPGIEGFIGYRPTMGCAIVFGDPICPPEAREDLARAFHRFTKEKKWSVVYIAATQSYAHWAVVNVCNAIIEFGEEFIFTPPHDPRKNTGTHGSLVRRKSKQAAREGTIVQEYLPHDTAIEEGIERVKEEWLASRSGLQVHISNVYLFTDRAGKRWFYAKQGERIIAVIALNQLQAKQGWLLNHLMVVPDAPNGVSELLMATVLGTLEKENCSYCTVGVIAARDLGEIRGLSPLSASIARGGFKIASKVIQLEGLNTFWGKFEPGSIPLYLIFSEKWIGFKQILSLKNALNGTIKGE